MKWQVIDSRLLWDRFHENDTENFGKDELRYQTLPVKSDLVLIIGTLQYILEDQLTKLSAILKVAGAESIFISRTPFSIAKNDLLIEQKAVLFDELNNCAEEFVFLKIRSVESVIEKITSFGYVLINESRKYPYQLVTRNGEITTFYQDLHFSRSVS